MTNLVDQRDISLNLSMNCNNSKKQILYYLSFLLLPYVYVHFNWLINKSCSKRRKCLISSLPFAHTFFFLGQNSRDLSKATTTYIHILSLLGDERQKVIWLVKNSDSCRTMLREKEKECHPNNDWQEKEYNGRNIEGKRERKREKKNRLERANLRSLELLFLLRRKKKIAWWVSIR